MSQPYYARYFNKPIRIRLPKGQVIDAFETRTENTVLITSGPFAGPAKLAVCSRCETHYPTWSNDAKDVLRMAKRDGWKVDEEILCKQCQEQTS